MTDTEREALCARIDELCQEVEKYRSARDASADLAAKTIDRIRKLEAEVERLQNQLHDQQDTAEHNFVRNAREYKRVCDENDKLHDEVERLHAEQAHWELGNCPSCPNVVSLQEALEQNAKLRGQYEAVIDDYRSEVAKLRELCGYLLPFAESCGADHPLMRELGIEVD